MNEQIKKWTKNAYLTQTELAEIFNIPLRTVQSWFLDEREPAPWVADLLIKALVSETEKVLTQKAQEQADRAKSAEDGSRPHLVWVIEIEWNNGFDSELHTYDSFEEGLEEAQYLKSSGDESFRCFGLALLANDSDNFFEDRTGYIWSDIWSLAV